MAVLNRYILKTVVLLIPLLALVACSDSPPVPAQDLRLKLEATKRLHLEWQRSRSSVIYQRIWENPDGRSGFSPIGETLPASRDSLVLDIPLHNRLNAQYLVQSCNAIGCSNSATVALAGNLAEAVGYLKASNTYALSSYGRSISLSGDGKLVAVGSPGERSRARNSDAEPDQSNRDFLLAGAVYLYQRSTKGWRQQFYLKASNTDAFDQFGYALSLSADGRWLAVGAPGEDSPSAVQPESNVASDSGAVYLFQRQGERWQQVAFIKADIPGAEDRFGAAVSLNADGTRLAVGAPWQDSSAASATDNSAPDAGAVYLFGRRENENWIQERYFKADNANSADLYGYSLALNDAGTLLAVGAPGEAGGTGEPADNSAAEAGAVYLWTNTAGNWESAYIKAERPQAGDVFGRAVSLNGLGTRLAVGAANFLHNKDTGTNEVPNPLVSQGANAVYLYTRLSGRWPQQGRLQPDLTQPGDGFGASLSLNARGDLLVVGAPLDNSFGQGVSHPPSQADYRSGESGAAYLYRLNDADWQLHSRVKASNADPGDGFGTAVALSAEGDTLAVGAMFEGSRATGVNGDASNNTGAVGAAGFSAGAAYLY